MGLLDRFRRRHQRESALAQIQAEGGAVSYGEASGAGAAGASAAGDWTDLLKGVAGAPVNVSRSEHSIDARNVAGLREEIIGALRQHGIDPDSPGAVDASSVPGLQDAMLKALQSHGIDVGAIGGIAGQGVTIAGAGGHRAQAPGDADVIAAQLKQLDELRAQGVLSQSEYKQQREKLLDQL